MFSFISENREHFKIIEKIPGYRYSWPMRLKIIIMVLAIFAFISATTGSLLYYYSFRKAAFQKTEADAYSRLNLLADQLSYYLSEHIKPVKVFSEIRELRTVLLHRNNSSIDNADYILDSFKNCLDLEVAYIMDKNAVTVCSSNRDAKDSFVGENFSFRPYYQKAIKGVGATYLALGTTSGKRGVYYSHPIFDDTHEKIIGVAVMKASVESVETKLFSGLNDMILFVDPNGIIFISNHAEFRFKLLWKLSDQKIKQIRDSRQFGNGPWQWTGFTKTGTGFIEDRHGTKYLFASLGVSNYPGWKIISLRNYRQVARQVSQPFVKVVGPVIFSALVLAGILVIILYHLGIREIAKRKKMEKDLRLSEERYRHIYHKTPVMLHSIDVKGRIVRVSDHWVEVMGYQRSEVIGRPLINFFTPESREYALNTVFPEFFNTGHCNNIPYTYIKKNGETMDILLSCYGVRDETGNIARTLAVSVDVTEKNRAQKDLQIAKEKLSQYSQDLEQQVKKRTAQLEKAQENLKNLSKNIIASQEREKALVARELHDHLGQVLTALRIDAVWAEKLINQVDESAGNRIKKMCTLIDDTINDVRDMAYRLRPRVLDDLGLADALESLLADFEKRSNVSCVFRHDDIPEINDTTATALYRIGQEAVTNALRHSNATCIIVELKNDPEGIVLTIKDDGCGFDTAKKRQINGFGLEGMMERAGLAGGHLEIFSRRLPHPSHGTIIRCKINLKG